MDRMLALHYMTTMRDDHCAALPANGPGCGLRICEALAVEKSDFRHEGRTLRVSGHADPCLLR
jgi:hypothetical protein